MLRRLLLREIFRPRGLRGVVYGAAEAVVVIALIALLVKWVPTWLASAHGLSSTDRAAETGRVRTALLVILASGIAIVGAIYTAKTFALNQQGQITERFSRAIDHLGDEKIDVRLGGIYALERIARESPVDHPPIMEVLTAYIRERSPANTPTDALDTTTQIATDTQAAASVVARRRAEQDGPRLNLQHVNLARADLHEANLSEADFRGANLIRADLREANFFWANLSEANLSEANLSEANLIGAGLREANLTKANLIKANLGGASFTETQLREAKLSGASLSGANRSETEFVLSADLREANLTEANLSLANLGGADLTGANLAGADLLNANLRGASLSGASLSGASLNLADFTGANLTEAKLKGASLIGVRLTGANLDGTDLSGVTLNGTDLSGADLSGANLSEAKYNEGTVWPGDFDPAQHGAQLDSAVESDGN